MSISIDSWESINELVLYRYNSDLPPYYDSRYLDITLDILGDVLGKQTLNVALTELVLYEPILSYRGCVIISMPLFTKYLNFPITDLEEKIKILNGFNIFDTLDTEITTAEKSKVGGGGGGCEVTDNNEDDDKDRVSLTKENKIAVIMLYRIAIMIHHWKQHFVTNNTAATTTKKSSESFLRHEGFKEIEFAKLK